MPAEAAAPARTCHRVQFYQDDAVLVDAVVRFVGAGLIAGDAGVVIATGPHREAIERGLQSGGLDLGAVRRQGRYLGLDAAATLASFMVAGRPDEGRFFGAIGDVLGRMSGTPPRRVVAFGEMVHLLWEEGRREAAIALERLWNEVASRVPLALLCAYPLGGLGIGLTVVRRLVDLHGGRVEARSDGLGTGAEFVVHLPIADRPDAEAERTAPPVARRAGAEEGGAQVLIVEDNVDAAEGLMMVLELLGHRVQTVHDGPAALQAVKARVPDVMIVDIGLPGMDGYEVARRVREQPALGGVVLVALTGYGRDEDRQRALEVGFDHHLVKPVDTGALDRLVSPLGLGARPTGPA